VLFVAMAPLLVPVAIWVYTLVFAFSALWFGHFLLAALEALRKERELPEVLTAAAPAAIPARSPPSPSPGAEA
jgi:hypothetical protein